MVRRDGRSCRIFLAFGGGIVELLPYNKQSPRKLLPVGGIITDEESLLTLGDDEIGDIDIHYKSFQHGFLKSSTFHICLLDNLPSNRYRNLLRTN